jgi:hypothetical protein
MNRKRQEVYIDSDSCPTLDGAASVNLMEWCKSKKKRMLEREVMGFVHGKSCVRLNTDVLSRVNRYCKDA